MKTFRLALATLALVVLAGCESNYDPNRICQDHPNDGSMCDDGSNTGGGGGGGTYSPTPTPAPDEGVTLVGGDGLASYEGRTVFAIVRIGFNEAPAYCGSSPIVNGTFSFGTTDAVIVSQWVSTYEYDIDWMIDVDGDGQYGAADLPYFRTWHGEPNVVTLAVSNSLAADAGWEAQHWPLTWAKCP